MLSQLLHKALAKAHDFTVRLTLGVKIGSALAATHGQAGKGVFKDLLKGQELQDTQVYRRVKAQAAFVGPDGAVHLHAVTAVYIYIALIIYPGHLKHNCALRLGHALKYVEFFIFGVFLQNLFYIEKYLIYRLVKFSFARGSGFDAFKNGLTHEFKNLLLG